MNVPEGKPLATQLDKTADLDSFIAGRIKQIISENTLIDQETLKIDVAEGVAIIRGKVDWNFRQESLLDSIKRLKNLKSVSLIMFAFK